MPPTSPLVEMPKPITPSEPQGPVVYMPKVRKIASFGGYEPAIFDMLSSTHVKPDSTTLGRFFHSRSQ